MLSLHAGPSAAPLMLTCEPPGREIIFALVFVDHWEVNWAGKVRMKAAKHSRALSHIYLFHFVFTANYDSIKGLFPRMLRGNSWGELLPGLYLAPELSCKCLFNHSFIMATHEKHLMSSHCVPRNMATEKVLSCCSQSKQGRQKSKLARGLESKQGVTGSLISLRLGGKHLFPSAGLLSSRRSLSGHGCEELKHE